MSKDLLHQDVDHLDQWFQDLATNSGAITTVAGIPAPEVKTVIALTDACVSARAEVVKYKKLLAGCVTDYEKAVNAANEPVRALVRRIKVSPGTTPALLTLLAIETISDTSATRIDAEKPVLKLAQGAGRIEISFVKHGRGGIRLYCKRGAETAFAEVGAFTSSPALDRRPNLLPAQAEHREYHAWYVDHDEPVGAQGDTASIAAAPTPA